MWRAKSLRYGMTIGTEVTTVFGLNNNFALMASADWLWSHWDLMLVTNSGMITVIRSSRFSESNSLIRLRIG